MPVTMLGMRLFVLLGFALVEFFLLCPVAVATELNCDGERIPSVELNNPNIACAILIDDTLVFPRNIATRNDEIWLIDKGSNLFNNGEQSGEIYRYRKSADGYERTQILSDLDDPNDIDIRRHASGEDWVYFTTRTKVQRFKVSPSDLAASLETIISPVPTHGWHKLSAIHTTQDSLYLTVPSSSDHCEVDSLPRLVHYPCGEEQNDTALIRRYAFKGDTLAASYTVVARGLRDALAVQINVNNTKLIVADNGWDQVDLSDTKLKYSASPHDEINLVDISKTVHFGWPYCFDNTLITPPYRRFLSTCDDYEPSLILLPAHSAPLAMLYFNDELLINLHGNNESGGKTVSFKVDDTGLPTGEPSTKVDWRRAGLPTGRPLGLSKTSANELLVTDDWNHLLIKIIFE